MTAEPQKTPRKSALSKRRAKIVERREQENELDEALRDSFPASDPVAISQPTVATPTKTGKPADRKNRAASLAESDCPHDKKQARTDSNRSDNFGRARSGRGETFSRDGSHDDHHHAQVHHAKNQKDCRQAGATAAAVNAETQAVLPGRADIGR